MLSSFRRVLAATSGLVLVNSLVLCAAEVQKKADAADISFAEPLIGYVYDAANRQIRSILGVPGAARVADAIPLNATLQNAVIGARGKLAITALADADSAVIVRPFDAQPVPLPITGSMKSFQMAAFSPSGTSAVLYGVDCNCLQVAGTFGDSPAISRAIDTTALPGKITALSINDGGSLAAVAVSGLEDGSQPAVVFVFDLTIDAAPRVVLSSTASGLAFSPSGKDLAVVDMKTHSLTLINDVAGDGTIVNIAGDANGLSVPTAVSFVDGNSVVVADRAGQVDIVTLDTNEVKTVTCYCKPDAVEPMALKSTYRLTGVQSGSIWILNLTESDAAVRFVPVDSGDAEGSQTGSVQ